MSTEGSDDNDHLGVNSIPQYAMDDTKTTAMQALTALPLPPLARYQYRSLLLAPGPKSPPISLYPPFSTWGITTIRSVFLPDIVITNNDNDNTRHHPCCILHPPLTVQSLLDLHSCFLILGNLMMATIFSSLAPCDALWYRRSLPRSLPHP